MNGKINACFPIFLLTERRLLHDYATLAFRTHRPEHLEGRIKIFRKISVFTYAAALFFTSVIGIADVLGQEAGSVLFVRGADRSGGFLEAGNDFERTEHLADINDTNTNSGNKGWYELAQTLIANGFSVDQMAEPVESGAPVTGQTTGAPLPFDTMNLTPYDVIVFGSNNATYTTGQVDAVENYIRGGGGAIFISDANFGSDWADASNSDQHFLDRFGLTVRQDLGTYQVDNSEFVTPTHPILDNVSVFDGEGVTPFGVNRSLPTGVNVTILALHEGAVRLNLPPFGSDNVGPAQPASANDAALVAATVDTGRVVGHFDRNTFFNNNGVGSSINNLDNMQLALNLFTWVANVPATVPEPSTAITLLIASGMLIIRHRS